MVADDLRIDMDGIDTKMPTEMDAKAKAVEERAGTDDAGLRCDFAGYIGERSGGSVTTSSTASGAALTIRGTMSR